jgi:hypothetical protein
MVQRRLAFLLAITCANAGAIGGECPMGDCKKADCAKKFGAPYSIHTGIEGKDPAIISASGELLLTVEYSSRCSGGGSEFTAHVMQPHDKPANNDDDQSGSDSLLSRGAVLYAQRAEPTCEAPLLTEETHVVDVRVMLPSEGAGGVEFIAFPPGGQFDMYMLAKK